MPQSKPSYKSPPPLSVPPISSIPRTASPFAAIFAAQAINEELTTQNHMWFSKTHAHAAPHASNVPASCLFHVGIPCVKLISEFYFPMFMPKAVFIYIYIIINSVVEFKCCMEEHSFCRFGTTHSRYFHFAFLPPLPVLCVSACLCASARVCVS